MMDEKPDALLTNVHENLSQRPRCVLCRGLYSYYHYYCDRVADMGWGCGYRTLQTICSWVQRQRLEAPPESRGKTCPVPGIRDIQCALVKMGDKPETFVQSRQWIGSFEVPCKIIHVTKGSQLEQHVPELVAHFQSWGSPVMMGGETDNSSKGIMGVCEDPPALLVLDPHYITDEKTPATKASLQEAGWIRWVELHELHANSFYNLCLPRLAAS